MNKVQATIRVPEDVLFHEVGGEAVILNVATGKYYGLDEVGTRMWCLLSEHGSLEPVVQSLLGEYDVGQERLQSDLLKLLDDLSEHGLVELDAPA